MVFDWIWRGLCRAFEAIKSALAKAKELLANVTKTSLLTNLTLTALWPQALRKSIELLGRILHAAGSVIIEELGFLMERT
jgi:hypothetical protein